MKLPNLLLLFSIRYPSSISASEEEQRTLQKDDNKGEESAEEEDTTLAIVTSTPTYTPTTYSPTLSESPTVRPPPILKDQCFKTHLELKTAIDLYIDNLCNSGSECGIKYGWPIGSWCLWNTTANVGVTDLSGIFYDKIDFNEDIAGWEVSRVTNMNQVSRQKKSHMLSKKCVGGSHLSAAAGAMVCM